MSKDFKSFPSPPFLAFPPISSKNFPSPPIIAIFEKFLTGGGGRGGSNYEIVVRFHWWSMYLRCWERSTSKNYCPVSFLSVVSKIFKKLVNNRIVDHLDKCGLFSDFYCGFRSSQSTADLLTVVSDRMARAFNRSGLLEL